MGILFESIVLGLTLCGRPLAELRWGGPALPGEGGLPKECRPPGEGGLSKEGRPPNPGWPPPSGRAKTLDLSITVTD